MPNGPSPSTPETPTPTESRATRCLELGRYEEAGAAYRRMVELDGSLASYSRLSGLKNLHGDVEGAIADLELAIRLGKANREPARGGGLGALAARQRALGGRQPRSRGGAVPARRWP